MTHRTTGRIVAITLDAESIAPRAPDVELERHKAISDLLHENAFGLKDGAGGPYRLGLALKADGLMISVGCDLTGRREDILMPLNGFRRHIRDYTILVDNFYKTARAGDTHRLEAIDAGRRGLHDEAAEMLAETLEDKVILDKQTARRLFSLVYVLHARTITS